MLKLLFLHNIQEKKTTFMTELLRIIIDEIGR